MPVGAGFVGAAAKWSGALDSRKSNHPTLCVTASRRVRTATRFPDRLDHQGFHRTGFGEPGRRDGCQAHHRRPSTTPESRSCCRRRRPADLPHRPRPHSAGLPREAAARRTGSHRQPLRHHQPGRLRRWPVNHRRRSRPGTSAPIRTSAASTCSPPPFAAAQEPIRHLSPSASSSRLASPSTTFAPRHGEWRRLMRGHGSRPGSAPTRRPGRPWSAPAGYRSPRDPPARAAAVSTDSPTTGCSTPDRRRRRPPRDGLQSASGVDGEGRMDATGLGRAIHAAGGRRPRILQKVGGLQGAVSYVSPSRRPAASA